MNKKLVFIFTKKKWASEDLLYGVQFYAYFLALLQKFILVYNFLKFEDKHYLCKAF